jgi:hypothetical protein
MPLRQVKTANQRMVICSVRTRPMRSESRPAIQPPTADSSSALVASRPACVFEMPQPAISVGTTKL